MADTLAQRLLAARSRTFVGRAAERDLFAQAVDADDPPFSLLWFHGPGGIGKSTLLRRLADEATATGVRTAFADARLLEPSPPALLAVARELTDSGVPPHARRVLFVDTAENLAPLDDWLREEFLPALPAGTVVVLASRHAPGPRWRADLGWAQELRAVPLGAFDEAASTQLLAVRGVPDAHRATVAQIARGNPLALALVADVLLQRSAEMPAGRGPGHPPGHAPGSREDGDTWGLGDFAEVLATLVERFVDSVPDPAHRKALAVFGHARVTTEGLLRAVVGEQDAAGAYAWLRSLSFAQTWASGGLSGLLPHDLARETLDTELRLRDHPAWVDLHREVRRYLLGRALATTGAEQARAIADLLWFHRDSPALTSYRSWDTAFSLWGSRMKQADLPAVLALVAEHEGAGSVALHEAWWRHQPEAFWVIRDAPAAVQGFVVQLRLDAASGRALAEAVGDPFALAALDHVARTAPLRPGEHLRIVRSWIGRDGYYRPTPTHQVVTGVLTRTWIGEAGLAVSLAFSADGDTWLPMFGHVDYAHAPAADVDAWGRRYTAFVHDWRVTPTLEWFELLEDRELRPGADAWDAVTVAQRHISPGEVGVLTQETFTAAVKDALKVLGTPAALVRSPLLRSHLVRSPEGGSATAASDFEPDKDAAQERARRLADVLRRQIAELEADPRSARLGRALRVTYVTPAATQEAAAARLSVPFSTYRRHLVTAVAQLSQTLWELELRATTGAG